MIQTNDEIATRPDQVRKVLETGLRVISMVQDSVADDIVETLILKDGREKVHLEKKDPVQLMLPTEALRKFERFER